MISNNYLEVLVKVMKYTCYVRSYATEFHKNRNKHHMRKQIEYEMAVSVRICYTLKLNTRIIRILLRKSNMCNINTKTFHFLYRKF